MGELRLPELPGGAARVVRWLVGAGDPVAAGAPLVIVLTERAEVLLPAPVAGALAEPLPVGALAAPGERLARLSPPEDAPAAAPPGVGEGARAQGPGAARRPIVTPLARRIALERGIDPGSLRGSGPGGRVCAADVRAAQAGERPGDPRPGAAAPGPGWAAPPLASATVELDAGAALAAVAAAGEPAGRQRLPVGLTAVVVAAAAALLPAYPELNGAWGGEAALLRRRVHIAVGEAGGAGPGWSVVRDAGDLTTRGVARALAAGGAGGEATFAVVSMAEGAGWQSAAPPLPGTAAALSVGAVARRVVALGDGLAVRPVAALTLSYDARLVDHRRAVAFLRAICAQLGGAGARAAAGRVL